MRYVHCSLFCRLLDTWTKLECLDEISSNLVEMFTILVAKGQGHHDLMAAHSHELDISETHR